MVVVELDVQALVEMKNLDDAIALYEFAKNNSLLVTICGCSDFPLSLFQMASVGMTP